MTAAPQPPGDAAQPNDDPDAHRFVAAVGERLGDLLDARLGDSDFDGHEADGQTFLDRAAAHLALAGAAKRARPRLVYKFAQAVSEHGASGHAAAEYGAGEPGADALDEDALVAIATAAELVHNASLLHDDVIDEADLRRDRPTVNQKWGNVTAILSGDLLLCLALRQLDGVDAALVPSAIDVVEDMTRGIMLEVRARRDAECDLERWRAVASGKTGALFGWCGYAPATFLGDADAADRFRRCGAHLGVAFQLADDLRDLLDPGSGKDRYADIRNGNPSYPLLMAMDASSEAAERLRSVWTTRAPSDAQIDTAVEAVGRTDAVALAREALQQEVARAIDALGEWSGRAGARQVVRWVRQLASRF